MLSKILTGLSKDEWQAEFLAVAPQQDIHPSIINYAFKSWKRQILHDAGQRRRFFCKAQGEHLTRKEAIRQVLAMNRPAAIGFRRG